MSTVLAPDRVLSTLNADGTRRFLRPKTSRGGFWTTRRAVAYALMVVFFLIPYVRMNGKPLILLDIPRRQFTIVGTTFLPTDMLLFMLLFLGAAIAVFLLTALLGRVWCGWACPQTVYMEFLFRPIEYWLEGGRAGALGLDRKGGLPARRALKFALYLVLALFLAHTFLAYFTGVEQLAHWVRSSPREHPTAFFVMALTTALILFDFTYFREQTCLVACPYGRLQAVLLDPQSLIVGYDAGRGEPRGRPGKGGGGRARAAGDCIDCTACVQVCPTGIDIRDGLQMECIHCTQCADACDDIMDHVGSPRGLIRYTSQARLEGKPRRLLRPRVVLYPATLAVVVGLFLFFLGTRGDTEITVLRGQGAPWTLQPDGMVANQVRIKVSNRGGAPREYRIALAVAGAGRMIAPENPLRVTPGADRTTSVFVILPRDAFHDGGRQVVFRVTDGAQYAANFPFGLLGPEGHGDADDHDDHEGRDDRRERR